MKAEAGFAGACAKAAAKDGGKAAGKGKDHE
mgnify:CR=1 FL=1